MRRSRILIVALGAFCLGLLAGRTPVGDRAAHMGERLVGEALVRASGKRASNARMRVLLENPSLLPAIMGGGAFGNPSDPDFATRLFSRDEKAIEVARQITEVEEVAPRTWLVRLPVSNSAVFETDEGLVIVDTGAAPAGPALSEAIRSVSDAPIRVIIYTHGHVDHAYGTWALLADGDMPEIVAHEALPVRFERYMRVPGSIARYMSQPRSDMPRRTSDVIWPTRTFDDRLELTVGGETFVLVHHRGETDDQLYVWVPNRKVLASAEYHQEWIPNAGNGKRVQRYVEEWSAALREMADLEAEIVLPGHGPALLGSETIRQDFLLLADALDSIVQQTLDGLDQGLRKDQVWSRVSLPTELVGDPRLRETYVSVQDVSKMVIRQYTGWWDDIPSHWSPAPIEQQAAVLVEMAGGMTAFTEAARRLLDEDVRLASHFADWAFYADPQSPEAQQLVLDVYKKRILDPESFTQEKLIYLDQMAAARARQEGEAEDSEP